MNTLMGNGVQLTLEQWMPEIFQKPIVGICAPCQDFSISGARAGLQGDRSSLVREVFRLLNDLEEKQRPEWLIYENVKGMLSSNKGYDFLSIIIELDELGMIANGKLSTQKTMVSHNQEKGCILSDILEDAVPKEYFLSSQRMEQIAIK